MTQQWFNKVWINITDEIFKYILFNETVEFQSKFYLNMFPIKMFS